MAATYEKMWQRLVDSYKACVILQLGIHRTTVHLLYGVPLGAYSTQTTHSGCCQDMCDAGDGPHTLLTLLA